MDNLVPLVAGLLAGYIATKAMGGTTPGAGFLGRVLFLLEYTMNIGLALLVVLALFTAAGIMPRLTKHHETVCVRRPGVDAP